jgi:hypothetical protein
MVKKAMLRVLFVLAVLIGLGMGFSCDSKRDTHPQPGVVMRVLDPSLEQFAVMWQHEVERRFDNAVVVLVHGGDFVEGQWIVGDWSYRSGMHVRPVGEIIREANKAFPGRTIVLVACNPGHLDLGSTGVDVPVYYAKSSVWCVPDRDVPTVSPELARAKLVFGMKAKAARHTLESSRWASDPDLTGNIFEFVAD